MYKQFVKTSVQEKLLTWLDEAWDEYCCGNESEFLQGKIYAYVECLEVILQSEGVSDEALLALEEQYGIR